jgi:hypothetical protein
MKPILIQQIYPDTAGVPMMELTKQRHEQYCAAHGYDFWWYVKDFDPKPSKGVNGSWSKIFLMQQAIAQGYERIVWLDGDTIIFDLAAELTDPIEMDHIGACYQRIPQMHHWNVGCLYVDGTSEEVKRFIDEWAKAFPGPKDGWNEQGVFNRMAMKSPVVRTISDRWNATLNYTEVPDAVVLGYHGAGDTPNRIGLMKEVLVLLEKGA